MLLFRSEEHVDRWVEGGGGPRGATMSVEQQWHLAQAWFENRMASDWRRPTAEEARAVFEEIGLSDPFWRLEPD
jgi:hypothetical protein